MENNIKISKAFKIFTFIVIAFVAGLVFGWFQCSNYNEWRQARAECEAQAAKIEKAWCDDNNDLIK